MINFIFVKNYSTKMKIIKETNVPHTNKRRITVELERDEVLLAVDPTYFYKLGYPVEDIVYGSTIADAVQVGWDELTQKWLSN